MADFKRPRAFNEVLCDLQYTKSCAFCTLLFYGHETREPGGSLDSRGHDSVHKLRSYPFQNFGGPSNPQFNVPTGVFSVTAFNSENSSVWENEPNQVLCVANPSGAGDEIQDVWNPLKAIGWLQTCLSCHDSCRQQEHSVITGMSLINCDTRTIVEANSSSKWIALSYVWGSRHEIPATASNVGFRPGSSLPTHLPRTIEDAIAVTRQLGYRFLWVDEYCIDQNNQGQREDQIGQMDAIYHGADLTIVAAAGEDKNYGLPGVDKIRRKRVSVVNIDGTTVFRNLDEPGFSVWKTKWFTRAWTFQEGVLSRRVLMFTDYQTSFHCFASFHVEGIFETLATMEEDPNAATLPGALTFEWKAIGTRSVRTTPTYGYEDFTELVETYSSRNLTFESDALRAFLGVTQTFQRSVPSAYNLCGLPFFHLLRPRKEWTSHVVNALSWATMSQKPLERRRLFPSWTWVGWKGEITFYDSESWLSAVCLARELQLENQAGDILRLPETWNLDTQPNFQGALDTVTAISFEAPVVPAASLDIQALRTYKKLKSSHFGILSYTYIDNANHGEGWIENVHNGSWSCLLLQYREAPAAFPGRKVMIVEWHEDRISAERIGLYVVEPKKSVVEDFGPLEDLEWRRVRLI